MSSKVASNMSNVTFVHDHKVIISKGKIYSRGGLSASLINSYQECFGNLTICSRVIETSAQGANLLGGDEVLHEKFPDVLGSDLFKFSTAYKSVKRACAKSDFVIARLPSISGLMACWYKRNSKQSLIVELVGCPYDSTRLVGGIKGKLLAPILYILVRYFVKTGANTSYVTQTFLQNRYPSNAENILSASDVIITLDPNVQAKRRQHLKHSNFNTLKLGMIGSYNAAYKGYHTALKALQYLEDCCPGVYSLDLVGGGTQNEIKEQAKRLGIDHCIKFCGVLAFPERVFSWLDTVDIFLQPSETEGLPRALVEAISRGCAAAGTNVGGIPELLRNDMVIKPGDHVGLAKIILKLSSNSELIEASDKSFERAKNYEYSTLKIKRDVFYRKVKEGILGG